MPTWPLVGRDDEIRRIEAIVAAPAAGGIYLAGPEGVGKSRLADQALGIAVQRGMAPIRVAATRAAASIPFGALAPLLPREHRGADVVPSRTELLQSVAAAVLAAVDGRRAALLVDDAHLLDEASAAVVHQLALARAVLVIVAVRGGESIPDAVTALWKDGLATRIDVPELSPGAVEALLTLALDGPVDGATVMAFVDRCRGNALYLRELLDGAIANGALVDAEGIWRLVQPLEPSGRLVELVETRLGSLDRDRLELLEVVSMGEPIGLAECAAVARADVVDALEREGLLTSQFSWRRLQLRLAHPVYGDVVRARMTPLRERAIAGLLAETLLQAGARRREDTLRLATWHFMSGGGDGDVLLEGAKAARARLDFALSEQLARAAHEAGAGFPAALLAAACASVQGRVLEADRELAGLLATATTDDERGLAMITLAGNASMWTGDRVLAVLSQAKASIDDPKWLDAIEVRRASVVGQSDGPRAAADVLMPLLERAEGVTLAEARISAALSLGMMGRIDDALELAELEGEAVVTSDPTAWHRWWHLLARSAALVAAGRFQEAESLQHQQYAHALEGHAALAQAAWAIAIGATACQRGHVRTAEHISREATTLSRELGRPLMVRRSLLIGAAALALSGRPKEADELLREVAEATVPVVVTDEIDLQQARAWTAVVMGDVRGAKELLLEAADLAETSGYLVGAASAWHGVARLGDAEIALPAIERLANAVEGELMRTRATHARGLAFADPALLDSASRDFETMGADLLAAEVAVDAAVSWRRRGDNRRAANALQRAATSRARCEGVTTPALQPLDLRAGLTPAERETAVLAATGRSSRDIAVQLCVSPRTVENRLQRVYEKLGVSSRRELADLLGSR